MTTEALSSTVFKRPEMDMVGSSTELGRFFFRKSPNFGLPINAGISFHLTK